MIILSHTPESAPLGDMPPGALCVHHRSIKPQHGLDSMMFETFSNDPRKALKDRPGLVLIGMTLARTPSNRAREFWDSIEQFSGPKIIVDQTLFVAEPWRVVWPFNLLGKPFGPYTYSYLAETHWRAHQDGLRELDPFTADDIVRESNGMIQADYSRHFDLSIETREVGADVHARYAVEKDAAFSQESTPAAIIKRLAAIAGDACPERSIPSPTQLFAKRHHHIVRTDLAVDTWLVGRLITVAETTNAIAEAFA